MQDRKIIPDNNVIRAPCMTVGILRSRRDGNQLFVQGFRFVVGHTVDAADMTADQK